MFVHIGTMKSATSYLQELCDCNQRRLRRAGLLWRTADESFRATDDLLAVHKVRPGIEGAWAELSRRIEAFPGDALISNELLAPIGPDRMTRLINALAPAKVHLLITARDPARVLPSQWQETAKNGKTESWAEFSAGVCSPPGPSNPIDERFWRKHGVAGMVTRWSKFLPIEDMTIITVPPAGSPRPMMGERFATAVGVDASVLRQPDEVNESIGAHSAELMHRINLRAGDFDYEHYRLGFKSGLARFVLADRAAQEPKVVLAPEHLTWLRGRADLMIKSIKDTGVRIVGDLNDLRPSDDQPTGSDQTVVTDKELLDVSMDSILGLGRVLADVRFDYEALMRDLESYLPPPDRTEIRAFGEYLKSAEDTPRGLPLPSQFIRWRIQQALGGQGTYRPPSYNTADPEANEPIEDDEIDDATADDAFN